MKSIYMIKNFKWHRGEIFNSVLECEVTSASPLLDCEQSLFFFRFSKGSARAREKRGLPVSRLQSRAWSFACLGRFARRNKKKERLLVV